jgi:quercetin dioxygenase-like cupin family protein
MSHGGKKPYIDRQIDEKSFLRTFSIDCDSSELHWHRDSCSRQVEVISGKDWKFQYDNYLPETIKPGDKIIVEKNEWHRIIKGSTDLIMVVHEK